ncbi:hypothetical protein CS0771_19280 [Catellatospora sp. IY07-71]|uniref:hypothetical protein n=1 Tax=Catellatospora sp. IY07-71 TaxID=2728827 RepID=UPI001BB3A040|nr:hypothetical protein [Catellatospora sp. IY07-71]BCJ72384.1 hypothetical protein CS0771_19280 [Catellatospora sp. IY07-71]
MHNRHGGWRFAMAAALSAATAAATVLVGAAPAGASLITFKRADSLAYTDSFTPDTAHVGVPGHAPVGAWRDDDHKKHVSRSYFTFDLAAYRGKTIKTAYGVAREVEVADCDKQRRVEVWRTAPVTAQTTWNNPPAPIAKLGELTLSYYGCPSGYLEFDALEAVRDAITRADATLTVELRIPEDNEGNVHLGRTFDRGLGISINANTTPHTPTSLKVDYSSCAGPEPLLISSRSPVLSAQTGDPDVNETGGTDFVYATFAIWPVADPSARREYANVGISTSPESRIQLQLPYDSLTDGTYAFQVKATDNEAETGWSEECRFTVDTVRPAGAPTVTSTDYPSDEWAGGGGVPGQFTFSMPGVADLDGFSYTVGWQGSSYVAADANGNATVTITPTEDGPLQLHVRAYDKARNPSESTTYDFYVRPTSPTIEDLDPQGWLGQARRIVFRPNMSDVVSYVYTVNYGPEQTVTAAADGTAQVEVTPQDGYTEIRVRSVTAAGLRSSEGWTYLIAATTPYVSSPDWPYAETGKPMGSTGTFTFRPHTAGVTEYVWSVDGQEPQTVAANADGVATVSWTATTSGWHSVIVYSRTAGGTESEAAYYDFIVDSVSPVIDSHGVQWGQTAGQVGEPISFGFSPRAQNVVSYTYRIGSEDEVTVPAGADGKAAIAWTPASTGGYLLQVRSTSADGTVSDLAYFYFYVNQQ